MKAHAHYECALRYGAQENSRKRRAHARRAAQLYRSEPRFGSEPGPPVRGGKLEWKKNRQVPGCVTRLLRLSVHLGCACTGALAHVGCMERAALAAMGPEGG